MSLRSFFSSFVSQEQTRSPVPLADDADRVFAAAVRVARRHQHEYIGTEHLLLGLFESGPNPALTVLERAGVTRDTVARRCDLEMGIWQMTGTLPLTPTATRVLTAAWETAQQRRAGGVDAFGLLIALALDADGCASETLARACADLTCAG